MKTPDNRRYRSWLINLALILVVFIGVQWWKARPLASGPAPALAGRLLDGQPFDLKVLRDSGGGRPVLVHFWATWCPVCRLGQDGIDAIARDHATVSVALQSGDDRDIWGFMGKEGLSFPVLPDPYGEAASAWGVVGVPASFVVDATGRIRFATVGYTTEAGLRARLWAAESLQ
jgi:thiol-disulfide isomerase/thioredoxin